MWFKKKSVLKNEGHYNTEFSADGTTDLRTTWKFYNNNSSSINNSGLPSSADAGNYFYLPSFGYYSFGSLLRYNSGYNGYYWSSRAASGSRKHAYALYFGSGSIQLVTSVRYFGLRVDGFE